MNVQGGGEDEVSVTHSPDSPPLISPGHSIPPTSQYAMMLRVQKAQHVGAIVLTFTPLFFVLCFSVSALSQSLQFSAGKMFKNSALSVHRKVLRFRDFLP